MESLPELKMMILDLRLTTLPAPWKWGILFLGILMMLLGLSSPGAADPDTVREETCEVVAEGKSLLGDDTTPAQAKALALNEARRIAIEKASGILVNSSSVVYNWQLISDLISAFSKGLIVKEEILSDGIRTEDGRAVYVCRIKARVKPLKVEAGKDIKIIKAEVARADRPFSSMNPIFQDNDEIRIRVQAEGDLAMNIFSVSQDGRVTRLLPNPYMESKTIPSRRDFIFPDEPLRDAGFKLRVHTPKNISRAYETIVVIATKDKRVFLSGKEKEATLSDLMQDLSQVEQSFWTDAVIGYEVRR